MNNQVTLADKGVLHPREAIDPSDSFRLVLRQLALFHRGASPDRPADDGPALQSEGCGLGFRIGSSVFSPVQHLRDHFIDCMTTGGRGLMGRDGRRHAVESGERNIVGNFEPQLAG